MLDYYDNFRLRVTLSIMEQQVKSLGKILDANLKNTTAIQKSLEKPKLTGQASLVDSKPGSTSIPSCLESCGICWSKQS